MTARSKTTRFRFWLWLIRALGVIVPRRLRADWRQEWEAELQHRETVLAEWDRLDRRHTLELLRRSTSAFWDAVWLQTYRWEDAIVQDLRYGIRMLLKQPGFTLTAVLTLTLGIGANAAIFSVVNMGLLKPLPYPNADRLLAVWSSPPEARNRWTSAYPDYLDWKTNTQGFEHLAVYRSDRAILRRNEATIPLLGTIASADLFPLLGLQPELGRAFSAEEDSIGASPVAVLSHESWVRYFHSETGILGQTISLGDRSVTVVGVMPPGFKFPVNRPTVDYYMPVAVAAGDKIEHRSDMFLNCLALRRHGVTIAQAQEEISLVAARLAAAYPDTNQNRTVWLNELKEDLIGGTRATLIVLFGSVLLVLLIACANVANLLLARAMARKHETTLRLALGATPARIVRQLLVESAILATAAGLLGLLCGRLALSALLKLAPGSISALGYPGLDARVMLFTLAVVVLVIFAAGLAPAIQNSRANLVNRLMSGARVVSDGRRINRARSALVVTQIAISVSIWVGAGLLVRSFIALRKTDPGFDSRDVLIAMLAPSKAKFKNADERNLYFERVLEQLTAAAGIESAAAIAPIPFGGSESDTNFSIVGDPPARRGQEPLADYRVASAGYFQVMKIPVLQGRGFSDVDNRRSQPVVVINEAFSRRYFAGTNPVGRSLIIGADPRDNPNPPASQIVGVVGNAAHTSLELPAVPEFYVPMMQGRWPTMDFVVRELPGARVAAARMRESMRSADEGEYVAEPRYLSSLLDQSLKQRQFTVVLLGGFAAVALLLATIGIFGVMSYTAQQRKREFAIRLALGAQRIDVLKLVLRQGTTLVLAGVVIGLAGARLLARLMTGLTFSISPTDALTFVAVGLLLSVVALLGCAVPAWRATRVDPVVSLRQE